MPAVPDLDLARIRKYCDAKVPAEFRREVRVDYGVRGHSVTVFECRPPWHQKLAEWSRTPVAQLRYDAAGGLWTLYWSDRNGHWHRYGDLEPSRRVASLLDEIESDPLCIFWG